MKKLIGFSVLYLYLPLLVFLFGWVNLFMAVPVILLTYYAVFLALRSIPEAEQPVHISLTEYVVVFLIILCGCIVCGHGGFFIQDYDWHKHNAVLHDLTVFRWPVEYDGDVMLTYYIGNYLIPALVGKCFSSTEVTFLFLPIWNALGLLLVYCLCGEYLNTNTVFKKMVLIFFLFFWSGAINLGSRLYHVFGHTNYVESWKWLDYQNVKVHFASNFDSLRGGFQHIIIPWVSCSVFMHEKERCDLFVLFALPLLFSSTFGFLWLAVLLFFYCTFLVITKKKLGDIFSHTNLLLLPLTIVVLVYLSGNVLSEKPEEVGFCFLNLFKNLDFYICFTLSEFLLYALFLFQSHKKDALFFLVIAELLLIPFFSLGQYNDLCSRGCVPARFFLMIWCLEELYNTEMRKITSWGIVLVFVFGLKNEYRELKYVSVVSNNLGYQQSECMMNDYGSLNGFAGNTDLSSDNAYNYYTMHYSDSLFSIIARE